MLETALQKPSSSPSETSLALLSFFRHEYPLGGVVEARFLRFFPILCDRIFGPILLLSGEKKTGNTTTTTNPSAADLALVQAAWLHLRNPWRSPSNHGLDSRSGSGSGSGSGNMNGSGNNARRSGPSSPYNAPPKLETDPVVHLLSPSKQFTSNQQQHQQQHRRQRQRNQQQQQQQHQQQQSAHNTCFLHILESTESSRQLKNIRLPFPFIELSRNLQQSFIRRLVYNQQQQSLQQQQQQQQQQSLQQQHQHQQQLYRETPADKLWQKMHYPPHDQTELINQLQQHLSSIRTVSDNMRRISPRSSPFFHLSTGMNQTGGITDSSSSLSTPSHQQQQQQQQQQQFTFDGNSNIGSGGINSGTAYNNNNLSSIISNDAKVMLDAWEYFMILFLRHGIYATKMKNVVQQQNKSGTSASSGGYGYGYNSRYNTKNVQPYGERVYYYLFKAYCEYYIQHVFDPNLHSNDNKKNDFQQQQQLQISIREQKSELWIQLVMEFFLEFDHVYPTTSEACNTLSSTMNRAEMEKAGLGCSFELASFLPIPSKLNNSSNNSSSGMNTLVRQSYSAQSKQVQRCLRVLIDHTIRDPAIELYCHRRRGGNNTKEVPSSYLEWPLQKAQTLLQPAFYNYVRTALRYGPVHVRNSSFYTALELWLTWLEPWNVVQRKKSSIGSLGNAKELFTNVSDRVTDSMNLTNAPNRKTQPYHTVYEKPKNNASSKYTLAWESYIAANLHLYVIPLAIFLRRAREFDFSKEGFQNAMGYVQRVLRIFSPQVVKSLDKLMNHKVGLESESSINREMFSIVRRHENILGGYCPPRPNAADSDKLAWNLDMLQQDMHAFLEEVVLQHRKTMGEQDFFERLGSRIQGVFFSEGLQAEERMIYTLVRKAKVIVHFPKNYEVFPNGKNQGDGSSWNVAVQSSDGIFCPEREQSGFITEKGRSQILEGSKICSAMDISFIGDPMYARVKHFEIEVLVKLAIFVSDWLNAYFKLVPTSSHHIHGHGDEDLTNLLKEQDEVKEVKFRVNLRFIADTRNWFFILIIFKITRWLF